MPAPSESARSAHTAAISAPQGVIALDQDGCIASFNRGAEQILGYTAAEIMGRPLDTLVIGQSGESHPLPASIDIANFLDNAPEEVRLLHKDGRTLSLGLDISEAAINGSRLFICVLHDRLAAGQPGTIHHHREEQFRALVEDSIQGVLIHRNFEPLFANKAWASIFGYDSPEEILGLKSAWDFFAPHERQRLLDYSSARHKHQPAPNHYEFQGLRKDGSLIALENTVSLIDWDGEPAIQSVVADITERKQTERALRTNEELIKSVVDNSPSAIFLKDVEGRFKLANSRFEEWYGVSAEAMMGKTSHDIYPEEFADLYVTEDRKVLESGAVQERVLEVPFADGNLHSVLINKFPVYDVDGGVIGVGTINTDITQQVRMEEHLRESEKLSALGQLAGGIAHDFNNLLMIIGGYTNRALKDPALSSQSQAALGDVLKASSRAAGLTKQLLVFSRRQPIESEVINIAGMLDEVRSLLRPLIGETIDLQIECNDDRSCLRTDPAQFSQVLVNLAINARDAMPSGGRLYIGAELAEPNEDYKKLHPNSRCSCMQITVRDEGEGMDAETAARIFDPFFTTKEPGKGTGLGLAMVYGFVQQSKGSIDIESTLGKGTTFSICLPTVDDQPESAGVLDTREFQSKGETILISEDDEALRRLTRTCLEDFGYTVLAASDGLDALEIEAEYEGPIHLLLTDIVMPRMGGFELSCLIRETRPETKVILISGYPDRGDMVSNVVANDVPFLHKPLTPDALAQIVRAVLDGDSELIGNRGLAQAN